MAFESLAFLVDKRNRAALLMELPLRFSLDLSADNHLNFSKLLARNVLFAHPDLDPLLEACLLPKTTAVILTYVDLYL